MNKKQVDAELKRLDKRKVYTQAELKFKHWLEAWKAKNAKVVGVGA